MKGKRASKIIIYVAVGFVVLLAIVLNSKRQWVTQVQRPAFSQADSQKDLIMVEEDGNKVPITITVDAQVLSGEQLQLAFDQTFDLICEEIKGNNPSLQQVTSDLRFVSKPGDYGIKAEYSLSDYSIISPNGEVHNEEINDQKDIEISVTLSYRKIQQEYQLAVTVCPKTLSEEEQLVQNVLEELASNTQDGEDTLMLPTEVNGRKVRFYEQNGTVFSVLLGFLVMAAAFVYYRRFVVPRQKREQRENALQRDYSELVSTLSLLVGAGMSVRNALKKIYEDYSGKLDRQGKHKKLQPTYEELGVALRRLDAGVPEVKIYQEYGKSCALHCYIRLSGLLTQSIRKGNAELLEQLSKEAMEAFEERKTMAIRAGEKASTRLVFPMMMLLAIVFIIIIVPAFASMYS